MATITLRSAKGSPLTNAEVDANFTSLNTDKIEASALTPYLTSASAALTYQPLDGDLTSIAGLAGTSGFLKKTAANTWSLDTNTYLTGNQSISFSGDASGSGTTAVTLTLATVNANVGTFNNVTVNAQGLVTAASNVSYALASHNHDATYLALTGGTMTGALTSDALGFRTPAQDRPFITKGFDLFTSGTYNGLGRWGLFMEPGRLGLGYPSSTGSSPVVFRYNADSTIANEWTILHAGNYSSYALPLTGGTLSGDITTYRAAAPTTGVIYFGNGGNRYLYYDGSNYVMPGTNLYVNGSLVWHVNNDGAGSGLDADLLDGNHASAFALSGHTHDDRYYTETESDARFLISDSSVQSNLDTFYSANTFGFSNTTTGRPEAYGQGIAIVSASKTYNVANNWITQLAFGTSSNTAYFRTRVNAGAWGAWHTIWNSGNDGAGSGLDADLLDGQHASAFEPAIAAGTTAQYWRGDKTWQTLNAAAVGLGSVMNYEQMVNRSLGGGIDLNTLSQAGSFRVDASITNKPSGANEYAPVLCFGGFDTRTQLYGTYSQGDLWHRSGVVPPGTTTWQAWRKVWDSGNLAAPSVSSTANTLVQRSGDGSINAYFVNCAIVNFSWGEETSAASHYTYITNSDGYIRKKPIASVRSEIVTYSATTSALGYAPSTAATANTLAVRDANGNLTVNDWYAAYRGLIYNDSVSADRAFGVFFQNDASAAYAIYRENGAWTHPYPDLRIAFHTGIKIGANAGYGGTKFYSDYDMATELFSINNGDNNVRVTNCNFILPSNTGKGINFNGTDETMHRIYLDSWWTVFKSHANEGWRFRNNSNSTVGQLTGTGTLSISGQIIAGSGGDSSVKSRHFIGKASGNDGTEHMYLQYGSGYSVYIGGGGTAADLTMLNGVIYPYNGNGAYISGNGGGGYLGGGNYWAFASTVYVNGLILARGGIRNDIGDFVISAGPTNRFYLEGTDPELILFHKGVNSTLNARKGRIQQNNGEMHLSIVNDIVNDFYSWGVKFNADVFYPTLTNDLYLGSTNNRWITVFSINGLDASSDINMKKDIQTTALGLDFVNRLNPVSYRWKNGDGRVRHGVIAQELRKVVDEFGAEFGDLADDCKSLNYSGLLAPIIKAVQELSTQVREIKEKANA